MMQLNDSGTDPALIAEEIKWHVYRPEHISAVNTVNVFKARVDDTFNRISERYILSTEEIERSKRFIRDEDRQRYIVRKHVLRKLLSVFTGVPPHEIVFTSVANNKPSVPQISFNVSHSKNYVLIGISEAPIGVDIEFINPQFEYHDLLASCFSKEEGRLITDSENPLLNFFTLWTRKEAYLKATGEGLNDHLDQVACGSEDQWIAGQAYRTISAVHENTYLISICSQQKDAHSHNFWEYIE